MAISASIVRVSPLKLSPLSHGDDSSNSSLFMGSPLNILPSPCSGKQKQFRGRLFVVSKRISGLEEAMRIRRYTRVVGFKAL